MCAESTVCGVVPKYRIYRRLLFTQSATHDPATRASRSTHRYTNQPESSKFSSNRECARCAPLFFLCAIQLTKRARCTFAGILCDNIHQRRNIAPNPVNTYILYSSCLLSREGKTCKRNRNPRQHLGGIHIHHLYIKSV